MDDLDELDRSRWLEPILREAKAFQHQYHFDSAEKWEGEEEEEDISCDESKEEPERIEKKYSAILIDGLWLALP
ncbi:hypothetical protein EPA93_18210 [Ktedonosporobacter rubrisoli]|uniref:Uncharacterized protein n=1 Tax=Ktedonosporobacter rubrisoli TaxID=2509675 RepID=A0A4P6JRA6_KTERU|nr:hypothetical protein [Ktedonosporobacter rubrisoli]QBD77823.1 hypothetical protein EPA93_18210 [Ktedonosporobacter rubrisoli]